MFGEGAWPLLKLQSSAKCQVVWDLGSQVEMFCSGELQGCHDHVGLQGLPCSWMGITWERQGSQQKTLIGFWIIRLP